jgi:hypothetical protein
LCCVHQAARSPLFGRGYNSLPRCISIIPFFPSACKAEV